MTALKTLLAALFLIGLSACDQSKDAVTHTQTFESSTIIKLTEVPNFSIEQEIKDVTSDEVIAEATTKTGLPEQQIRKALSASKTDQPLQIKITASGETAEQATDIAAATADSYIAIRNAREVARAMKELRSLNEQIEKQTAIVEQHRSELTKLIGSYGGPYFDEKSTPLGQNKDKGESLSTKYDSQILELKAQIETLSEIDLDADILQAAVVKIEGFDVAGEYQKYRKATKQLTKLENTGIGSRHPGLIAAKKLKKSSKEATKQEFKSGLAALKMKQELLETQRDKIKDLLSDREEGHENLNVRHAAYEKAKAAYEESRDKLRALKKKLK